MRKDVNIAPNKCRSQDKCMNISRKGKPLINVKLKRCLSKGNSAAALYLDQSLLRCLFIHFIYSEQILKTSIAHWWSPDGKYLAYAQFDDTDVQRTFVTSYGDDVEPYSYPQQDYYYYPKVRFLPSYGVFVAIVFTNVLKIKII